MLIHSVTLSDNHYCHKHLLITVQVVGDKIQQKRIVADICLYLPQVRPKIHIIFELHNVLSHSHWERERFREVNFLVYGHTAGRWQN
jgi:hypothetical protein